MTTKPLSPERRKEIERFVAELDRNYDRRRAFEDFATALIMLADTYSAEAYERERAEKAEAALLRFYDPYDCGDHCSNSCKQCQATAYFRAKGQS